MAEFHLATGQIVYVDASDLARVLAYHWHMNKGYVARTPPGLPRRTIRLHRELTGCPTDLQVDHLDGDKLNNRRANLEIVTQQENMRRALARLGSITARCAAAGIANGVRFPPGPQPDGLPPETGIHPIGSRWRARIGRQELGRYPTRDLARAAREAALAHYRRACAGPMSTP